MRFPRPLPAALLCGALLGGCTAGSDPATDRTPDGGPAASPGEDLSGLRLARAPFCDALDSATVTAALGGPVRSTGHYGNGDRARLARGVVDVSHEYNCTFAGASPALARAWVFARPVVATEAASLARDAAEGEGCTFPTLGTFGRPSAVSVCALETGEPAVRGRISSLFGDSWLSCELTAPRGDGPLDQRREAVLGSTEQWCAAVANALAVP